MRYCDVRLQSTHECENALCWIVNHLKCQTLYAKMTIISCVVELTIWHHHRILDVLLELRVWRGIVVSFDQTLDFRKKLARCLDRSFPLFPMSRGLEEIETEVLRKAEELIKHTQEHRSYLHIVFDFPTPCRYAERKLSRKLIKLLS